LIPRRHAEYLYNVRASSEVCELDTRTVYLTALPMAHNFTLCCPGVIGTLLAGGAWCVRAARTLSPALR